MKLNIYQKLTISIFATCIIFTCVIYVPYISTESLIVLKKTEVLTTYKYAPLWAEGNIYVRKLLIEVFAQVVVFGSVFLLAGRLKNPDFQTRNTKRIIKRELLIGICITLLIVILYGCLQIRHNSLYNRSLAKDRKIIENLHKIDSLRKDIIEKKSVRKSVYDDIDELYNVKAVAGLTEFWEDMLKDEWFIGEHGIKMSDDIIENNYRLNWVSFKSKSDLMAYFRKNTFTDADRDNDKKAAELSKDNLKLRSESHSLTFKDDPEKRRRIFFIATISILSLAYPLRYILFKMKTFIIYLRS